MEISDRYLNATGPLAEQAAELWRRQATDWPQLADGLAALRQSRTRSFDFGQTRVEIQCNPARIKSASAKVDAASIAARPCVLCPHRLPEVQRVIPYGEDWLILCNPVPIIDPHLTIVSVTHQPQRVDATLPAILELAFDFGGAYTVFYNGPSSGASLPDHLHLQATPAGQMPFEQELTSVLQVERQQERPQDGRDGMQWLRWGSVRVGTTPVPLRPAVVLVSESLQVLAAALADVIRTLEHVLPSKPEPMMNLFARYTDEGCLVWLFPRAAYRPSIYGTGPEDFLINPGAIDLCGVMVVPRPHDLERLDEGIVQSIYDEVLLAPETFASLRDRLADGLLSDGVFG